MTQHENGPRRRQDGATPNTSVSTCKDTALRSPWQRRTLTPDDFRHAREDFHHRERCRRIGAWVDHQNWLDRSDRRVRGRELDLLRAEVRQLRLRVAGMEAGRPIR